MDASPSTDCYADFRAATLRQLATAMGLPTLMIGEYRNPFHILDEGDQWFEFEKRRGFDSEPTWRILADMLAHDLDRANRAMLTNFSSFWFSA